MLLVPAGAIASALICILTHYEFLRLLSCGAQMLAIAPRQRLLCVVAGALGSHLVQITIFALALKLLALGAGIVSFEVGKGASLAQALYISFESYAALGGSQAFGYGPLRVFAGVEGLSGLLLIGWSSAFTYWCMTKYWEEHPPRAKRARTRKSNEPRMRLVSPISPSHGARPYQSD